MYETDFPVTIYTTLSGLTEIGTGAKQYALIPLCLLTFLLQRAGPGVAL